MDINYHLEEEWKNYKTKSIFKSPVVIITLLFAIVVLGYLFLFDPTKEAAEKKESLVVKVAEKPKATEVVQEEKNLRKNFPTSTSVPFVEKEEEKKVLLVPNLSFEEKLQSSPIEKNTEEVVVPLKEENIIFVKNDSSIDAFIESFQKDRSYEKALQIAKMYYSQKEYKKAIRWAVTANEIDTTKEDSWIVFTKSQIAIGKVEIAVEAIDSYLKEYESEKLLRIKEEIFQ